MAFLAYSPEGHGIACDESPSEVATCFEAADDVWVELHSDGLPIFVDKDSVFWIELSESEAVKSSSDEITRQIAKLEGMRAAQQA